MTPKLYSYPKTASALLIAFFTLGVAHTATADTEDEDGDHEIEVEFADAPSAVQSTIKRHAGAATPNRLEKEDEHGKVVYEASYKLDGLKQSLAVAENGELLELEKEIAIANLPTAVVAAVKRSQPGGTLTSAEAIHIKGAASATLYEVKVKANNKTQEMKIKPNGELER